MRKKDLKMSEAEAVGLREQGPTDSNLARMGFVLLAQGFYPSASSLFIHFLS